VTAEAFAEAVLYATAARRPRFGGAAPAARQAAGWGSSDSRKAVFLYPPAEGRLAGANVPLI
jgi:hypothetical protein